MERLDAPCSGKIFMVWGLYGLAVVPLSRLLSASGMPGLLAWSAAAGLGLSLLLWTRGI